MSAAPKGFWRRSVVLGNALGVVAQRGAEYPSGGRGPRTAGDSDRGAGAAYDVAVMRRVVGPGLGRTGTYSLNLLVPYEAFPWTNATEELWADNHLSLGGPT
jgi:hypothetical protein